MAKTTLAEAAALEAEAERHPEERGDILLDAAVAWRRAGRVDRAREVLAALIEEGGEDGCYARVEIAEIEFDEGAREQAYAELARLARDPALHSTHCEVVGELLAEREDIDGALAWFDRGIARLSPEELEAVAGPDGWFTHASTLIRCRRDVRERAGLPPDATDQLAPERPSSVPADLDEIRDGVDAGLVPSQVRVLAFQRDERAAAQRRWPDAYPEPDDEYYPATEREWRELADSGVPAIRVAPASVSELAAFADAVGGDATDPVVKARYAETIDELIVWPPGRNERCWCGSGGKYKKCCGRILAQ